MCSPNAGLASRRSTARSERRIEIVGRRLFELAALVGGRRQAGEVERHAPQQSQRIRLRRRLQSLRFQSSEHEAIERLPRPVFVVDSAERRRFAGNGWNAQCSVNLRPSAIQRRNNSFCSADKESFESGGGIRTSGSSLMMRAMSSLSSGFARNDDVIESVRRACRAAARPGALRHRAVAAVALVGEDRTDVAIVGNSGLGRTRCGTPRADQHEPNEQPGCAICRQN